MKHLNAYFEIDSEKYQNIIDEFSKSPLTRFHGLYEVFILAVDLQRYSEKIGYKTFILTKTFVEQNLGMNNATASSVLMVLTASGILNRTKVIKVNGKRTFAYKISNVVLKSPKKAFHDAYWVIRKLQTVAKTKGITKIKAKHIYEHFGSEKASEILKLTFDYYKLLYKTQPRDPKHKFLPSKTRRRNYIKELYSFLNTPREYFDSRIKSLFLKTFIIEQGKKRKKGPVEFIPVI
mgnify:CR=1 FL=1